MKTKSVCNHFVNFELCCAVRAGLSTPRTGRRHELKNSWKTVRLFRVHKQHHDPVDGKHECEGQTNDKRRNLHDILSLLFQLGLNRGAIAAVVIQILYETERDSEKNTKNSSETADLD